MYSLSPSISAFPHLFSSWMDFIALKHFKTFISVHFAVKENADHHRFAYGIANCSGFLFVYLFTFIKCYRFKMLHHLTIYRKSTSKCANDWDVLRTRKHVRHSRRCRLWTIIDLSNFTWRTLKCFFQFQPLAVENNCEQCYRFIVAQRSIFIDAIYARFDSATYGVFYREVQV